MRKKYKVPVILQMEAVECGAVSLTMILSYYKRYIPLEKMRIDCNVTRDGCSAKYIIKAAKMHGMDAKGFKTTAEKLKEATEFPMIIHWNFNHFVVLCGFDDQNAIINDPAVGRVKVDWETFVKSFTGIALKMVPGENFEPYGKPKNTSTYLRDKFQSIRPAVMFIVVMGIVYALLGLMPPVFYKIYTDRILLASSGEWMQPLLLAMFVTAMAALLTGSLRNIYLAKLKAKFRITSASAFAWKVLRLPIPFFSQRFSGDIIARAEDNEQIATLLFDQMIPAFMDLFMLVCMFVLMLVFNYKMAFVVLAAGILQIAIVLYMSLDSKNIARSISKDSGKMSGAMLSGISMIETVKSSGAEAGIVEKILGYQTKYDNSLIQLTRNRLYLGVTPVLLQGLCNAVILIMGIYGIFVGKQTVGMLIAFQSFLQMFFSPLSSLAGCIQANGEIAGSVDRIQDVMEYEEDITEKKMFRQVKDEPTRLSGELELKNVAFSYSPVTEPLIRDFSLHAKPGQVIALSGGSGSGKSTLAKLICGLYKPNQGEILFDGQSIENLDHYVFADSVAVVDQNISLFEGTVYENLTMWDESVDIKTVIKACKKACIHEDIITRRDGYQYKIREGGTDFSGGQRQRMEIARAFVSKPSILILDEATSALDVMTEKKIMEAVKKQKITCFIIAHRLSTIRDADEIIMLDHGSVVERGTHEELMKLDGKYASLVKSD